MAEQLRDAQLLRGVVFDDEQPLPPRRRVGLDLRHRRFEPFGRRRLGDERERTARQAVLAIFFERHDLHRDVARLRVLLQLAQHRPAQHVGQEDVERHRHRPVLASETQRLAAAHRDQHLEALVVGQIDQDARVVRIVFDDQQDRIVRIEIVAVVGDRLGTLGDAVCRQPHGERRLGARRDCRAARHARPGSMAPRSGAADTA